MSNFNGETYRNWLAHFRVSDLKLLLGAFGQSIEGRRPELRERALELLISIPDGFNYIAYRAKIYDIHLSMSIQRGQRTHMNQQQISQQRTYQLPQYPQQSVHMTSARLPQFPSKIEGLRLGYPTGTNSFPRNTVANNHIQCVSGSYQPVRPHTVVSSQLPTNQNTSYLVLNPQTSGNSNASVSIPSSQIVADYKFKKLPFYDVIKDTIKPTSLNGSNTVTKYAKGMIKCEFKYTMSNEEIELIAMNRDTSNGKCDYPINCQIRICQLEQIVNTEVTDELPKQLFIQINGTTCPLPSFLPAQPGKESRLTSGPINCAQILKLNPIFPNLITINWIPDGKEYALAMFIVKQVSADTLIKKLYVDKVRSLEETKHDIIKKLTVVDPDLASTSITVSLVCPLSTVRMKIPAKSIHCNHLQCFDAGTFILMNEKKPKWMCPTCYTSCLYDEIRIDGYFLEIVENLALGDDIKEIELLDDGSWIVPEKNTDIKNTIDTIDDTVIEIDDLDISTDSKEEPRPDVSKCQEDEALEKYVADLIMDDEEEPSKQKDKPENID
ncbi:E3 SUMO-protein ligase PIAS1-like [Myzus persicae]|uniref:E3 SUMO-protein ligase PIAS1-like n=1 Tax=Myzus persicae TaxID=13164 RepID=UPI000B934D08|nr:E3 SUMO-protein ligase PIAS1-like [Myzus persicae]